MQRRKHWEDLKEVSSFAFLVSIKARIWKLSDNAIMDEELKLPTVVKKYSSNIKSMKFNRKTSNQKLETVFLEGDRCS